MNKHEYEQLQAIAQGKGWEARPALQKFLTTVQISEETPKQRTGAQNNALHLYFKQVADAFNDAGLDIRAVIKQEVDIPWTPENVKEYLWRPVQKLAIQKESTAHLTKHEVSEVWEIFNRAIAKHGIHVPFPSDDFQVRMSALNNLSNTNYPSYEKEPVF